MISGLFHWKWTLIDQSPPRACPIWISRQNPVSPRSRQNWPPSSLFSVRQLEETVQQICSRKFWDYSPICLARYCFPVQSFLRRHRRFIRVVWISFGLILVFRVWLVFSVYQSALIIAHFRPFVYIFQRCQILWYTIITITLNNHTVFDNVAVNIS